MPGRTVRFAALGLAASVALSAASALAAYVPVSGSGYNVDVVVQAGENAGAAGRFLNEGQALYEAGSHGSSGSGLPVGGLLTSIYDGTPFQLAPYGGLNAIITDEDGGTAAAQKFATFTFDAASKQAYTKLSLLGLGAGGGANFSAVVFFTDGSNTGLGYEFEGRTDIRGAFDGQRWSDWFDNNANLTHLNSHQASNLGLGRVDGGGGVSGDNSDGGVRLQQIDLDLSAYAGKIVDRIEFEATGGGGENRTVLAITGTVVPEPTVMALLGASTLGLLARRRV